MIDASMVKKTPDQKIRQEKIESILSQKYPKDSHRIAIQLSMWKNGEHAQFKTIGKHLYWMEKNEVEILIKTLSNEKIIRVFKDHFCCNCGYDFQEQKPSYCNNCGCNKIGFKWAVRF